MDSGNLFDVPGERLDVTGQFVFVGVTAESVDGRYARPDFMRFAKDVDRVFAGEDLRPQRVFRTVADE